MVNLACGFNPNFFTGAIRPHSKVKLIEIGFRAYRHIFRDNFCIDNYYGKFSLHISRSPITEVKKHQKDFITDNMKGFASNSKLQSIGYHIMGERTSNIGKYGFTSHYTPSKLREERAINFINLTRDTTGVDVWLENANFYSSDLKSILLSWQSIIKISEYTNTKIIFDISHLIIDCLNCNASPNIIIGMIPWDRVSEVHLSGIITGKNGILHDGHSEPINDFTWEILDLLLKNKLLGKGTYLNIEHTDSDWHLKLKLYENDFNILNNKISTYDPISSTETIRHDASRFAKGYVKKILADHIENLQDICQEIGKSKEILLSEWIIFIEKNAVNLCLTKEEEDGNINNRYITNSFRDYIKEVY